MSVLTEKPSRKARDAARRVAFELLYAEELGGSMESENREGVILAHTVRLNSAEIDAAISARLRPGFAVGRLGRPDRILLRLGVAELLFEKHAPGVLAAYTDLAAEFGDEKTPGFVNGLLASVAKQPKPGPDMVVEADDLGEVEGT